MRLEQLLDSPAGAKLLANMLDRDAGAVDDRLARHHCKEKPQAREPGGPESLAPGDDVQSVPRWHVLSNVIIGAER